jgi:DNA-binding transcriptional LysR family regulator
MALEDIEVFTEVVVSKSFTRAAKRLGMPTSTVSAKIARLEERLGVTLIQRTTRQLNITDEGNTYYEFCVRALAEMSQADDMLARKTAEPKGPLRITAPADLAHSKLVRVVETFLARFPNVSVELNVTNRKVDLIGEGIDLAVRIGNLADSSLIARKYVDARIGLWASEGYLGRCGMPLSAADLKQHEMIEMTLAHREVKLFDNNGNAVEVDFSGRLATDDMQNCRSFIENGTGIGPLPDFMGGDLAGTKRLIRVLPNLASAPTSAYFVYPAQRYLSQNVRAFIDCALECS